MKLTNREFEVLNLLANCKNCEMPTAEAARLLGTSRANVQTYRTRLHRLGFSFQKYADREKCRELLANLTPAPTGPLNERQLAILKRYALGQTYREIADALTEERVAKGKEGAVQVGTITQYLCHIFSIMGPDFKHKRGDTRVLAAQKWLLAKGQFTQEEMDRKLPKIPAHKMLFLGNGLSRHFYVVYGIYEGIRPVYIGCTPHPRDRMHAHRDFFPNATKMVLMHGSNDPEEIWRLMDQEISRHNPRDNRPDFTPYANSTGHAMPPRKLPAYDPNLDPANY